jgi:hypothetical protein
MNTCDKAKVGPDGRGSYRYMIGGRLSASRYHNPESARHDARRAQFVRKDDGLLQPCGSAWVRP